MNSSMIIQQINRINSQVETFSPEGTVVVLIHSALMLLCSTLPFFIEPEIKIKIKEKKKN